MRKALLFSLFFVSCAKFGPPPGGPEDKTPPEVLTVAPSSGSIQVDSGAFFEFVFSENVARQTLAANVFISPPLADSFHDEWKGKTYRVYPNRYLRKDATYVVSLGTGVRDLHGNPLAQAYSFAFSTGEQIDSGEIAGQVFDTTAPVSQAFVKAFRVTDTAAAVDWKKPDYQTSSGRDGRFRFSFLPSGRYRLLASSGQKFGLYHRDVLTAGAKESVLPTQFFLEPLDTAKWELRDARMNPDRLLVLTFNRPLEVADTLASNFEILTDSPGENIPIHSVFTNPDQKEKLYLVVVFPKEEKEAIVRLYGFSARTGGLTEEDSAAFLIGSRPDNTPPKPIFYQPPSRQERTGLSDTLKFYFSEPVSPKFEGSATGLFDSLGASVPLVWSQPQANAFFFVPQSPLRTGEWYRLRFPAGAVADRAGNPSADSLVLSFRTYFSDSLGTVTGRFTKKPSGPVVFEFRELRSNWSKTEKRSDSSFTLPLLAGKYFLFGFVDRNDNGKRDAGSLAPFDFPEPAFFYPDTVFVRARFETEGIDISIR